MFKQFHHKEEFMPHFEKCMPHNFHHRDCACGCMDMLTKLCLAVPMIACHELALIKHISHLAKKPMCHPFHHDDECRHEHHHHDDCCDDDRRHEFHHRDECRDDECRHEYHHDDCCDDDRKHEYRHHDECCYDDDMLVTEIRRHHADIHICGRLGEKRVVPIFVENNRTGDQQIKLEVRPCCQGTEIPKNAVSFEPSEVTLGSGKAVTINAVINISNTNISNTGDIIGFEECKSYCARFELVTCKAKPVTLCLDVLSKQQNRPYLVCDPCRPKYKVPVRRHHVCHEPYHHKPHDYHHSCCDPHEHWRHESCCCS